MTLLNILLQAQPAGGGMGSIIMIVALIAIFYFFMIRPQSKKQKEIRKFRESLKNGDKVITAGGIYGKIKEVSDKSNTVILEISDGVKIRIDKGSIYQTVQDAAEKNNLDGSAISKCCRGELISCGGFFWSYINDENKIKSDINRVRIYKKVYQYDKDNNYIREF